MQVHLNDQLVTIPSSLHEFTLGQRIDYEIEYGRELTEMLKAIVAMEEGPMREIETMQFQMEKMFRTFAFFAGATVEAVKDAKFIDDIASIYYSCLAVLFEEEQEMEFQREFAWNHELWELATPELNQGSKTAFGEFIDAKQIVKDLVGVGAGKWECMLPLCAIYLRKKGEAYDERFVYPNAERVEMMKGLPMSIAMQVGFFLTSTMNFLMNTLKSSGSPDTKEEENMSKTTSSVMAG